MPAKKTKINVLGKSGEVVETGTISTKTTAKTPEGLEVIPEFEKPIVSVTVNNPLKKIMYWLNEIRKHQTTTLAFKLSIPLIALPVIIFAAFSIGRGYGINIGKSQNPPNPPVSPSESGSNSTISKAGVLNVAKGATTKYLLKLRNGEVMTLQIPAAIDLTKYANKQVLVTGVQDKSSGILAVADIAEITVYNVTTLPQEPTASASLVN